MEIFSKLKASAKLLILAGFCVVAALCGTIWYAYHSVAKEVPEITRISDYHPLGVTQIISIENGEPKVMAEFYRQRRYLTPYDQIPPRLVKAFLSAEDSTFFEHQGINFVAIMRAAVANFMAGQVVQGGSTITQQISKSLYLSSDRNFMRKVKELFLALQLEKSLTKEEILYLYLNQIYLGSGSYGVEAAARVYFHKSLKKLTTAEMALIAGLPTAPGKYSPLLNPKKAKERQLYVLKRMKENKVISENEQKAAAAEKIKVYISEDSDQKIAPHLVEYIRRYLEKKYGDKQLNEEGMTVIVPPGAAHYAEYAQEAIESGLEEVDQRRGYRGPEKNITEKDWGNFKEELRKDFVKENYPFRYLSTEGTSLDSSASYERILPGKKFKALITGYTADLKSAIANIGVLSVQIPLEGVKWATPPGKPNKTPKAINEVLHAGDVVWVKVTNFAKEGFHARLIQIPEIEGALYSVDAQTGLILAMVGGYDYKTSQFNRAVQAKRQMGSSFKPVIYSAAVERGYTPASIIVDSPVVFEDKDNGVWKPENDEEKFYGDTTFGQALVESRNIPTIKIVQDIKVSTVIEQAKRLGIQGPFNNDLSISLGSAVTTVQDLVHAYTAFPLQGKPFKAALFEKIIDRDGRTLETGSDLPTEAAPLDEKVNTVAAPYAPTVPGLRLDPRVAYVMSHLMKEVVEYGTAKKASGMGHALAGKTGTTQDFRDGWFVGFSPRIVTGVWVGFDDQRTMGHNEFGANTALPIWMNYMEKVLKDYPNDDFAIPDGVTFANIDAKTGKLSNGAHSIREAFISGTEPGAAHAATPVAESTTPGMPGEAAKAKPTPGKMEQSDEDVLREDE
jgi:penicillin-binding protein 1A